MKLNRVLTLNRVQRQLIDERIALELHSPGRAQFTVLADDNVVTNNQLVTFDFGYSTQEKTHRWFIGLTEKVVPVGDKQLKVFCRELSSVLSNPLPLNLRHVSARDVVEEINRITGLNFSIPDKPYAHKKVANFYNVGSGYQALESMGRVFKIPDYIWQQQSGVIYVGSWADSRWASIKNMMLPEKLFDGHSVNESASIAAIPFLRPGMRVRGNRLTSIEFQKNHMTVSWKR